MPDSRPRLVVRLVGIADYMSAGLEGNDNHTSTRTLNIYNECTCTVTICNHTTKTDIQDKTNKCDS